MTDQKNISGARRYLRSKIRDIRPKSHGFTKDLEAKKNKNRKKVSNKNVQNLDFLLEIFDFLFDIFLTIFENFRFQDPHKIWTNISIFLSKISPSSGNIFLIGQKFLKDYIFLRQKPRLQHETLKLQKPDVLPKEFPQTLPLSGEPCY